MFSVKKSRGGLMCEDIVVLTNEQFQKLECQELQPAIDALCKDMHIEGRYCKDSNYMHLSIISATLPEYDDTAHHTMEMTHLNFLNAVDKLELPKPTSEEHEEGESKVLDDEEEYNFIKETYEDYEWENLSGASMHTILPGLPVPIEIGTISSTTLKELFKCYLEVHKR
jgi:hypothetical protein